MTRHHVRPLLILNGTTSFDFQVEILMVTQTGKNNKLRISRIIGKPYIWQFAQKMLLTRF